MKYKVNFKSLSTKQKIEYVWDYYRWYIIAVICGITIIVSTISHVITYKEPLLSVIMLNSYSPMTGNAEAGFDEFFQEFGYGSYEGALELKQDLYFQENKELDPIDYQNYEILLAMLIGGDYDVFLGIGDVYLDFVNQGFFADLSEILSDDLLDTYEEQIIYADNMGEITQYPAAIILENNQWLVQNNYYNGECYLGILEKEHLNESAIEFSEFLLKYER